MSGGDDWFGDYGSSGGSGDSGGGRDENAQTGETQNAFDRSTTYAPPGTPAPIDQYNYVPNGQSAGGYDTYGPGQQAPTEMGAFSNTSGQPPDDNSMANAIGNQTSYTPTITADGSVADTSGFYNLDPSQQATWNNTYGAAAAPFQWAQQAGVGGQSVAGFNALPADQQNTWYSVYGANAPQVWQQQSQQNATQQGA